MLEYIALAILVFAAVTLFYGIIVIHDIPYEIAKHRNHPQQDALHVAGWISLFTLHVLWPFLWIWATLYREDRGWGFNNPSQTSTTDKSENEEKLQSLNERITLLEEQLAQQLEKKEADIAAEQKLSHDSFSDIESSIIASQEGNK
ncbi:hypothetical protein CW745_01905 [Psychromonas sp. psych-6C06]|uniref:DUF3302 domain-containing protein n=1 Tax=Psychromonas sp. psych-6C06 TaxID=2058089 RepID=UPI000C32F49D|nr:DUF3302 domain-containing protein [Psychromonas sp. psych-6C06]PKF63624.1 hypothetical protein CW745_01905 [Psychromonas sp. psych-6C06]